MNTMKSQQQKQIKQIFNITFSSLNTMNNNP